LEGKGLSRDTIQRKDVEKILDGIMPELWAPFLLDILIDRLVAFYNTQNIGKEMGTDIVVTLEQKAPETYKQIINDMIEGMKERLAEDDSFDELSRRTLDK
jgi:hypothetical protein